ncbi:MAG TPA: hypothetical protein VGN72_16885 [Tepidisphaeraceae bacterium]|jgi:hypothetical protein|nr:hypothetical protein [Tepidisphaeraceae bacterium]
MATPRPGAITRGVSVTAGTIVTGVHMQMCDDCLRRALWETLAELEDGRAA